MSTLGQIRTDLTAVLGGVGVPVAGFLPDRFTPPLGVLVQGSPYLEQGETFGVSAVRFQLVLIAGNGTNETVTTTLDQLIEQAFDLINASDSFFVEEVDQPALYTHGQGTYLSCVISVRTDQRLGA